MRLIKRPQTEIILEENDTIIISALMGNKHKIQVSLKNGAIEIDDLPLPKIQIWKEEQKAIQKMIVYKEKKKNHRI